MADDKEKLVTDLMDKVGGGIEAITHKITDVATQYGPEVLQAGLNVVRIDCLSTLVYAFIGLVMTGFIYLVVFKKGKVWFPDTRNSFNEEYFVFNFLVLGFNTIFFAFAAINFINLWTWVGVIEPKLYLAHKLVEKLIN